jgi:hypothetical protein
MHKQSYIYYNYMDKRMIKKILAFLIENSCSESLIFVLETFNLQNSWIASYIIFFSHTWLKLDALQTFFLLKLSFSTMDRETTSFKMIVNSFLRGKKVHDVKFVSPRTLRTLFYSRS